MRKKKKEAGGKVWKIKMKRENDEMTKKSWRSRKRRR